MSKTKITLTAQKLEDYKKKYGAITVIKVKEGDQMHQCVIKDPYHDTVTMAVLSKYMQNQKTDPMYANIDLLKNLMIEADSAFESNNKVIMAGAIQAVASLEILESESEKP